MKKMDRDIARKREIEREKAFGFKSLVSHRSSIVDTGGRGLKKTVGDEVIYRSICPIIRACIWPECCRCRVSSASHTIESRSKRNLAFRSRWLRHGLIRLALSARRLRDGDGLRARVGGHTQVCAHPHPSRVEQQPSSAYNIVRAYACIAGETNRTARCSEVTA